MIVFSKTPYRISLSGGGTDTKHWFNKHSGYTLSFTIDKYCYISVRNLPNFFKHKYRIVYSKIEQVSKVNEIKHPSIREVLKYFKKNEGLEIHHDGDLPARSGIGSSSAFTVGMLNALNFYYDIKQSKESLANKAIYIEQNLIKENVGCQDQLASSLGGINFIEYKKGNNFNIKPINISKENLKLLEDNSMLLFTDLTRNSDSIQKQNFSNYKNIENKLLNLNELTKECYKTFLNKNLDLKKLGSIISEGWTIKKDISNIITNYKINNIMNELSNLGIYGQKLIGAGGGGFIFILASKLVQNKIKKIFSKNITCNFKVDFEGSQIIFKSVK